MPIRRLSHIGITVSDLERSRRFYCEQLGFTEAGGLSVSGEPSATLLALSPVSLQVVFVERDGTFLELMKFHEPGESGKQGPAAMNRLGLAHLSLRVDDLAASVSALRDAGVPVLEDSRISNPEWSAHAVFITDPDGLRIELYQGPGDPERPLGC